MKLLIRSLSLHSARGRNYPRDKRQYEGGDFCRRAPPPLKPVPAGSLWLVGLELGLGCVFYCTMELVISC